MPDANEKKARELREALRENLRRRKAAPVEASGTEPLLRRTDSLSPRLNAGAIPEKPDKKPD